MTSFNSLTIKDFYTSGSFFPSVREKKPSLGLCLASPLSSAPQDYTVLFRRKDDRG